MAQEQSTAETNQDNDTVKRNTQKTKDYQNKTGKNQTIRQRLDKIQEKWMLQKL